MDSSETLRKSSTSIARLSPFSRVLAAQYFDDDGLSSNVGHEPAASDSPNRFMVTCEICRLPLIVGVEVRYQRTFSGL